MSVAGLGEDAYWDKTFSSLNVLKGRCSISLYVAADATGNPQKTAQSLAKKLLSRLP